MKKIKCPYCGILAGEVDFYKTTKHFICNECSSRLHTAREKEEIKVELI